MEIHDDDPVKLISKLLHLFNQGIITEHELISMLIEAATQHEPSALAKELPVEWLNALQDETANLPSSPADMLIISGITGGPNFDYAEYYRRKQQNAFEGMRHWHFFFAQQTLKMAD